MLACVDNTVVPPAGEISCRFAVTHNLFWTLVFIRSWLQWRLPKVLCGDDTQLRQEAKSRLGIVKAVADTAVSAPDARLGRALFWDVRLSADGKTACASCHRQEDWGGDRRQFSPDAKGKLTSRNSQTVLNSMEQPSLRWRGDRESGHSRRRVR